MKAARWHGNKDVRVEDVPEPSPGANEVKIKVKWCALCGTDLHEYRDGPVLVPASRPHPLTGKQAPVTLGHEFSGDVVAVGSGVSNVSVGDRVCVNPLIYCNNCYWCWRGRYNECAQLGTLGLGADGALAEYVVAPAYGCYRLPPSVSYEMGALTEPLAVAVRGFRRGGISIGDNVAIIGAGPIGLLSLQVALAGGAGQVFVINRGLARRELALRLGATAAYNPQEVDPGKEISKLTDRVRADVALECAGGPEPMKTAVSVSKRAGRIVLLGISARPYEFDFDRILFQEKEIIPVQGYVDEFPAAISLLANGKINTDAVITGRIKLADIVTKGFEALIANPAENIKILVSPE
ncbi:MAG: 2,3-butanediol dehydrogenase [Chloroflexota bacterium]